MLEELFRCLNSSTSTQEERQNAQNQLLGIQRDPSSWSETPKWLANENEQIQFFGAQCLLIRINRDWCDLEEETQIAVRNEIVAFLARPNLSASTRSKLEEALVRIMERSSTWWKDPIMELFSSPAQENLRLLSLMVALASKDDTAAYRWHHQIKDASARFLLYLQSIAEVDQLWLDCLRNWINFGAFNFPSLLPVLPRVFQVSDRLDVVDVLVEACELATRDQADEAKKLEIFIPFLEQQKEVMEEADLSRIASALTESTATVLVSRCADSAVQQFFWLLLRLTGAEGIAAVEEDSSALLMTAWYLICEASGEVDVPASQQTLLSILAALAPILLQKATLPEAKIWASLPRDQQQQFLQIRREFLDTFLYIHRVFQTFGSPALLQFMVDQLQSSSTLTGIEVRLRALIVIAEESEEWTPQWSAVLSLLFSPNSYITKETVNAKLAISLVGCLLPCMDHESATQAVQMLLCQLENTSIADECLTALQRAVDCEISCLQHPQTITQLAQKVNQNTALGFIRFIGRLLSDCPCADGERFQLFCQFLLAVPMTPEQRTAAFKAFQFPKSEFIDLASLQRLRELFKLANSEDMECFISALEASSQSGPLVVECLLAGDKGRTEANRLLFSLLESWPILQAFRILCAVATAWTGETVEATVFATRRFFSHRFVDLNEQDEAAESLIESWIRIKCPAVDVSLPALSEFLHSYALARVLSGSLSVPTLRAITRFICFLVETDGEAAGVFRGDYSQLITSILSAGMTGKLGRSGLEIASRILYEVSLKSPTHFAKHLAQSIGNDERVFLRSIGAAHTFKKFKTVLVEFCIKLRTGE